MPSFRSDRRHLWRGLRVLPFCIALLLAGCLALPQTGLFAMRLTLTSLGVENVRIGPYDIRAGLDTSDLTSLLASSLGTGSLPIQATLALGLGLPSGLPPVQLDGFGWKLDVPGAEPVQCGCTVFAFDDLEAQRLGLETEASDLNPVAVLINKALIELPAACAGRPPVFPGLAESQIREWRGAEGLGADVRAYGAWLRQEAACAISQHYPGIARGDGTVVPVIAWIWARTVRCPNPICAIEMPLVRSWWLGKKKGNEAYVRPVIGKPDAGRPARVEFEVIRGNAGGPSGSLDGTVDRGHGRCVSCGGVASNEYIRAQANAVGLGARLIGIVAASGRGRQRRYARSRRAYERFHPGLVRSAGERQAPSPVVRDPDEQDRTDPAAGAYRAP